VVREVAPTDPGETVFLERLGLGQSRIARRCVSSAAVRSGRGCSLASSTACGVVRFGGASDAGRQFVLFGLALFVLLFFSWGICGSGVVGWGLFSGVVREVFSCLRCFFWFRVCRV